jgi:HEPN domain-containing protein
MGLILEASKFIQVSKEIEDACRVLNRYYIPTRYPNAFLSGALIHMFNEDDAKETSLRYARKVIDFAKKITEAA